MREAYTAASPSFSRSTGESRPKYRISNLRPIGLVGIRLVDVPQDGSQWRVRKSRLELADKSFLGGGELSVERLRESHAGVSETKHFLVVRINVLVGGASPGGSQPLRPFSG